MRPVPAAAKELGSCPLGRGLGRIILQFRCLLGWWAVEMAALGRVPQKLHNLEDLAFQEDSWAQVGDQALVEGCCV